MRTARSVGLPSLLAGGLWFAFYTYPLWHGSVDIPAEILVLVLAGFGILMGMRWPGVSAAVAVGLGAFLGNLAAFVVTDVLERFPEGENRWFYAFVFGSIPIAAHTIGTFLRGSRRAAEAGVE